jgi:hypothetical protein
MNQYKTGFQSRYDGRCGNCGEPFHAGEVITKVDGRYQPIEHIGRCERAQVAPESFDTKDGKSIIERLQVAKAHLQYPKIRVILDDEYRIVFRLKGQKSKAPGTVDIVAPDDEVETRFGWGARWLGRIELDGSIVLSRFAKENPVGDEIQKMADGFEDYLAANGRLTGVCCYCGRQLTDERSTAVGYGPICAGHFGLPWGSTGCDASEEEDEDPTLRDEGREATMTEDEVAHAKELDDQLAKALETATYVEPDEANRKRLLARFS